MKIKKYILFFWLLFLFYGCSSIMLSDKQALNKILNKRDDWKELEKGQLTLYYIDNSEVAKNVTSIFSKTELAITKAKQYLGEEYNRPIHVVTIDDRNKIKKLIGRKTSGTAFPGSDSVVEVARVAGECHEKFHVLSVNVWGMPKHWINEGMAVACDNNWWGNDLHELANYLLQNDKITPLKKLTKNNWSFRTKDSRFTYPQAGSLIKFIDEKYGREKLLTLWKDGNIQNSLGTSIEEFEYEWHEEIKQFSIEEIKYFEQINYAVSLQK